jgi:16S rRNA (guanine966-N2)-methyltransferase
MRVIAGKYRGRPLRSLGGKDIRPTSDRLRETLFNVLTAGNPAALEGTVWLDLFAGTGAVGIEALQPRRQAHLLCRDLSLRRRS